MSGRRILLLTLSFWSLFVACRPERGDLSDPGIGGATLPAEAALAEAALVNYFERLQAGKYAEAAQLYGGSYEVLQGWNPAIDPSDHATLLRNGCSINGLNCLQTRKVTLAEEKTPGEFIFIVEFASREGELFVQLPCCGADETEQPPVSQWPIRVAIDSAGRYQVLDLPPYTP